MCASSFSRLMVRTGRLSASAIACSFQPRFSRSSTPRQMSTLVMDARIRFSDSDTIGMFASSSSFLTSTSIVGSSAVIAAFTRRPPALTMSSPSASRTTGGWMMPIALIEATSCSSIAGGTGVRRGLFGFGLSVRGSTLRSSAMVCSCVDRFCLPSASGDPPPPAAVAAGRGKGEAGEAGPRARARVDPCGGGRHCGTVVPVSEQACLFALLSGAAGFRRVARMQDRRARL